MNAIPVRDKNGTLLGYFVPRVPPAERTAIPEMPDEYVVELKKRAATPEQAISWEEFRAKLNLDGELEFPR